MIDLSIYPEKELSLRVFNDRYFYIERETPDFLIALVKEEFFYTPEQMAVLLEDLAEDAKA